MQQILLIDDSRAIHTLVAALLGEEPVTIHSAFDAQFGLTLAASLRPDLILLDVDMPGVDGYQACLKLKADPATATIPVVFLTARIASEDMIRGLDLGAIDFISKPFKLSELLSRVRAALRTSHLIRLLEEKARIDPLTGLGNRAMFDARLAAEIALRIRTGNPLSCIIMNVDHFRTINDKHGRPFGDHVLSQISEALNAACRIEDVACRLEGDEFAVLLPQTCSSAAALLAERMRSKIEKISILHHGQSVTVTGSFGVAEAAGTFDRLMLERADQSLSTSQQRGGNRVAVDPLQATAAAA
jgi:diguanylate cyclase (GGDEF)-like protein